MSLILTGDRKTGNSSSNNVNSTSPSTPSAFHSVVSSNNEAGQPPPSHPAIKTTPPGTRRRHSSSGSEDSSSSVNPRGNQDEDENPSDIGDTRETAFDWPSHSTYDERRQLIGTEEESSERPSSDEDEEKNPWTITREQLSYYTTQFLNMQPNSRGVIPGELAKEFFEKSRLPISELRKIWQLSDVTKDGCLSLEEFLTAMHLVVLRRNEINLPEKLPPCLQPMTLRNKVIVDNRHNKDLYCDQSNQSEQLLLNEESQTNSVVDGPRPHDHPIESEIETPNSISSPKPVNFDFRDARMNPRIIQPVPVRLSPDSPVLGTTSDDDERRGAAPVNVKQNRREVVYEQLWNQEEAMLSAEESLSSMTLIGDSKSIPATSRNVQRRLEDNATDEELDDGNSTEVDALQDLTPSPPSTKELGTVGPVSLPHFSNALHKHQNRSSPPLPPPRPVGGSEGLKTHARSSSLDLNNISRPPVPPRNSDTVTKKSNLEKVVVGINRDSRTLQMKIHDYREKNSVIARTINELHQEVSDTLEERIALEFHLEQLKSFGD